MINTQNANRMLEKLGLEPLETVEQERRKSLREHRDRKTVAERFIKKIEMNWESVSSRLEDALTPKEYEKVKSIPSNISQLL